MAETIAHGDLPPAEQHAIVRWSVADLAALDSLVLEVGDRHKVAFVADTRQYYMLVSASQAIWKSLTSDTSNPVVAVAKDSLANTIVFTYKDGATTSIALPADENSVVNVTFDEATDILVFTYKDGAQATLDLASEAITVDSAAFDTTTETLTLTMSDASTLEVLIPAGGGGLEHLVETLYTAAPNDVVNAVQLKTEGVAVDITLVLSAKGAGAIQAHVPDGTAAGGNKRGVNAVDFQRVRSLQNHVAGGISSVIVGGEYNRASGAYAVILGGRYNVASGTNAAVAGGYDNSATQTYAGVLSGRSNTAGGLESAIVGGNANNITSLAEYAFIGSGRDNTASEKYATVVGGESNMASGRHAVVLGGYLGRAIGPNSSVLNGRANHTEGGFSIAAGYEGTDRGMRVSSVLAASTSPKGNAQRSEHVLYIETTDGISAPLTVFGLAPAVDTIGSTNVIVLPDNSAYVFKATVVAKQDTGDTIAWEISGLIKRGVGTASTALVGVPSATEIAKDTGATAWDIAVSADTTLGSLMLTATGEAAKTIRWVANVIVTQVTF